MEPKKAAMSMGVPLRIIQRVCIWFSMKDGVTAADTFRKMKRIFGHRSYSETTVFRWHKSFKNGRGKIGDKQRPGHAKTAKSDQNIDKCKQLVKENWRVSIFSLSRSLRISYGSVHGILHKELGLRKRAPKMVPHKLTAFDVQRRLDFCTEFVSIYGSRPAGL